MLLSGPEGDEVVKLPTYAGKQYTKKCLTRSLKEDQRVTRRHYMAFFFLSIPEHTGEADKINCGNPTTTNSNFI